MPRSNFNQTNPKKADYIVGRENIETKKDLENIGGGASKLLIVTVENGKASHTSSEITEYVNQGYTVLLDYYGDSQRIALTFASNTMVHFSHHIAELGLMQNWEVNNLGQIDVFKKYLVDEDRFNQTIGDIDSTLDSIIAIQESLIGGGNV